MNILVADVAFVDRADIKAYVGPPTLHVRYEILRSCVEELISKGIISSFQVQYKLAHTFSVNPTEGGANISYNSRYRAVMDSLFQAFQV